MKLRTVVFLQFCLYLNFLLLNCKNDFRQERARIGYANPKYVANASSITVRKGRGLPYVTNINNTIIHSWGNNVTMLATFNNFKGSPLSISYKLCDALKIDWIKKMVARMFVYNKTDCPFQPGTYYIMNVEIPTDFPLILSENNYEFSVAFHLTKTKVKLIEIIGMLRPEKPSRN